MGSSTTLLSYLSFSLVLLTVIASLFSDIIAAEYTASSHSPHRYNYRKSLGVNTRALSICQRTSYPSICISTSKKNSVSNPKDATVASVQASISITVKARAYATKLIRSGTQSGATKASLKACKVHYSYAVAGLQNSLENVAYRDKGALMSNLSAALASIVVCRDEFANCRASPLATYNRLLNKLTSNNLALASHCK